MDGMMPMNNHLKGVLGFESDFDLGFLLIVDIWHDVQKGSGYTLSQYLSNFFQYIQPVMNLCNCVLISDTIFPKKLSF